MTQEPNSVHAVTLDHCAQDGATTPQCGESNSSVTDDAVLFHVGTEEPSTEDDDGAFGQEEREKHESVASEVCLHRFG